MSDINSKEYIGHKIFDRLNDIKSFYDSLSFGVMKWVSMGTKGIVNLDTYVFSSIAGTIESVSVLLKNGRINDGYALLRKYYDSTFINVYTNLYLNDHFSIENFVVSQIDGWIKGTEKIPEYRVISQYIKASPKLKEITDLLQKDDRYKNIRERCNAHTHYNFYKYHFLNDKDVYIGDRTKALDTFLVDFDSIFIQHFAYLFFLHDHYFMSEDYTDYIDMGDIPPEDSQYWVATYIQNIFDKVIKEKRPDIAAAIKNKTSMHLE